MLTDLADPFVHRNRACPRRQGGLVVPDLLPGLAREAASLGLGLCAECFSGMGADGVAECDER